MDVFGIRRIPFQIADMYHGLAETEGMIWFEHDVLCLEFETKDSVLGLVRSGVKEKKLFLQDIDAIEYIQKVFKTQLTIRARRMTVVDGIPGNRLGEIQLRFKKRYRHEVSNLASQLALRLSEKRLEDLDEEMKHIE